MDATPGEPDLLIVSWPAVARRIRWRCPRCKAFDSLPSPDRVCPCSVTVGDVEVYCGGTLEPVLAESVRCARCPGFHHNPTSALCGDCVAREVLPWRLSPATNRPGLPVNGERNDG